MEYGQPNEPEEQNNRTSNLIGEQYLNSVVGNPAELTKPAKQEKQRKRRWPVGAIILTVVLAVLLSAACISNLLMNSRMAKLESAALKTDSGSDKTAETNQNSGKTQDEKPTEQPSGVTYAEITTSEPSSVYGLIADSMKTVVSIDVMQQTSYGSVPAGSGSGVIISADGCIVTCQHVIDNSSKIYVYLNDGTSYEAELMHEDSVSDLAILKIDAENLTCAKFADSDSIYIGQEVFAIGNMLGELSNSCTRGCISGINRSVSVEGMMMTLVQTDAAINHGNSGGGLFRESDGALVGIVNAKSDSANVENLAFAIPANDVAKVVSDLLEKGYVTERPYLGVATKDVHLSGLGLASYFYVYPKIVSIDPDSPAAKAGLHVNDVIMEIDGTSISGKNALASVLYSHEVGDTIKIVVRRGNSDLEFTVTLVEYKANQD